MTKGIKTDKAMAVLIPAFRRLYTFCSDEALVQYWTHLPGVPTTFGQEFEKKYLNVTEDENFVKVCLHSSTGMQTFLQFDDLFA